MSQLDVTKAFEAEFAKWQGTKYALAHSTGTAALEGAMFGCGIGRGDEIICQSVTYWASAMPCYNLGATVVFAEIDPVTLCLAPNDIERRISKRTKAILVVHYMGYPTDMDPIMKIARKHKLLVIEDVSHAQGGLYKGRKLGTIGDVAGMSLMSEKSFADRRGRDPGDRQPADLRTRRRLGALRALPEAGRYRDRVAQGARGPAARRTQVPDAPVEFGRRARAAQALRRAVRRDPEGPQLFLGPARGRARPAGASDRSEGPEDEHGRLVLRARTLRARGTRRPVGHALCRGREGRRQRVRRRQNQPLHLHPVFNTADVYGDGKPTRIAFSDRDLRQRKGSLPVSEAANARSYYIPSFKKFYPKLIEEHAMAFRKAAENYRELLKGDPGDSPRLGDWHFARHH